MKNTHLIGMAISVLAVAATSSQAQISDNESSAAVLAAYCARSSGLPASNYESYCRELALTISQLPVVAQSRVFEDKMPLVAGADGGASDASDRARERASENSAVVQAAGGSSSAEVDDSSGANHQYSNSENDASASSNNQRGQGNSGSGNNSKKTSRSGGLMGIVEAINSFLFGRDDDGAQPVIGGSTPTVN